MKTRDLVLTSLFMGIVFAMGVWPNLGFITITPTIQITIIHIPVIIGGIFLGKKQGALIGLAFGLVSFLNSLNSGAVFAPIFANPIVSVLPRIAFGWFVGFVFETMEHIAYFKKNKVVNYAFTAALTTFIHSIVVVSLMYVFGLGNPAISQTLAGSSLFIFVGGILVANSIFEIAAATVIVPAVSTALAVVKKK